MYRSLVFIILLSLAGAARSAMDFPIPILQSHLTFGGGDLLVSTSDNRLSLVKLTFLGKTRILQGDVLAGLGQPFLDMVGLKATGALQCADEKPCDRHKWPMVEIEVADIPEEPDCTDCDELIVQFRLENGRVLRSSRSRKAGRYTYYPERVFQLPSD